MTRACTCARVLVALILAAAVSACGDTPTAPSAFAPYSAEDLRVGTGPVAAAGNLATFHYRLWLYDSSQPENKGPLVESSVGSTPLTVTVRGGDLIQGVDQGLEGMAEGGLRRLVIPPSMGYGPSRNGAIPPYATLVFEVELIDVEAQA